MRLYYAPLACSLADHIALHEAGAEFDLVRVDIRTKDTEIGQDFRQISAKGYVPALVLEDGQILTENIAVLDWLSGQFPALAPQGPMGRPPAAGGAGLHLDRDSSRVQADVAWRH